MQLLKSEYLSIGENWVLEAEREMLINKGEVIPLSRIQFKILYYLAINSEVPVSCKDIVNYAWGNKDYASKNTLYVYIYRLRGFIEEDARRPRYLLSIRNYGYILYK
ncbi:winged helix-turn-helix domain-containing protein [Oceanobacillus sp. M65]|uniref:winged helix-turn-helix domain-containing protein n=1 Tax=Oceanobacillus sp. M65 TaxID=3457435 RepID=UPI000D12FA96|nr:transcriptional regulator [Oceanobacillus iheyensis]